LTVRHHEDGTLLLEGRLSIEDAELMQRHLAASPATPIDWSACEGAHTAAIQILLASQAPVRGRPQNVFLRDHIGPLLERQNRPLSELT
jgi:hypothetical protein